jgi:uncharacterized membrane protein
VLQQKQLINRKTKKLSEEKAFLFLLFSSILILMQKVKKYLWILPALFVACEFADKLLEVLESSEEFANIIYVVIPSTSFAKFLAYVVGVWDFLIALALLIIPNLNSTKKYSKYIFLWVIFWPLVPASISYFCCP